MADLHRLAFVQPRVPIGQQMWAIVPTALTRTALGYTTFTAIGAGLGRLAIGALMDVWLGRGMAALFVGHGVALRATGRA